MHDLSIDSTVGEWVAHKPHTARVFEELRIDYCCRGNRSLNDACAEGQVDLHEVLHRLVAAPSEPRASSQGWNDTSLSALAEHIESTHHAYLRNELPRLQQLIDRVCVVHGESHPELAEVKRAFTTLHNDLMPHMLKEERILFPAIRAMEAAAGPISFPFGSVANPIHVMEHEHDAAGDALSELRRATNDFAIPKDACQSYRAMLEGLCQLEQDMHQHVHKENNILFPRAQAMERTRTAKTP